MKTAEAIELPKPERDMALLSKSGRVLVAYYPDRWVMTWADPDGQHVVRGGIDHLCRVLEPEGLAFSLFGESEWRAWVSRVRSALVVRPASGARDSEG